MKLVEVSVKQPISIIVGILFTFLAGMVSVRMVAVEMAPEVDDTIIAVTTFWENASPQEIESEVVDPQEEKLQSISNLRSITSVSSQGQGQIRLEFNSGIDKDIALRDVSDKLREVPSYPFGVDEPVIEATDPDSQDYIAWYILSSTDENYDVRKSQTFAEDQLKPILERVPGVSEVNALGGVEREVQIEIDPDRCAELGVTLPMLVSKLRDSNSNASAGALPMGKLDVRLRSVGRFSSPESVKGLVLRHDPVRGAIKVGDVARVKESFKDPNSFVRASGRRSIAFNFQREPGTNVLDIMDEIKTTIDGFQGKDGLLAGEAKRLGLDGELVMEISYDATRYVRKALVQVEQNIYIGGALAVLVLLIFLRSLRSLGIIAISIPVSMVGAIVLMVALGRTVNVISLAGIAFAVGMVVDNSIVVLENIYRHLEMGKSKGKASVEGASEVAGAVLASSLTTLIVFIPILLITDQVGQLFRDISLAIMTAVAFSYLVAVTVIPSAGAKILNAKRYQNKGNHDVNQATWYELVLAKMLKTLWMRWSVILVMAVGAVWGAMVLMPPMDYLPKGNRNITFGLILPPPGLNIDELETMGKKVEATVQPYWEGQSNRPPLAEPFTGREVYPTDLSEYFLVSQGGILFHGGISTDDRKAVDNVALLQHASRQDVIPGTFGFAFQFPLFRLGGSTGSAVKINLVGRDLDQVSNAAGALFGTLFQSYGPGAVRPDPSNFNLKVQEVQLRMKEHAIAKAGLNRSDVVLAMQAAGDGIFLGEYEFQGDLVDLKLWSQEGRQDHAITKLEDVPIPTPSGVVMPLGELAEVVWTQAAEKIKRVARRRAVTLEFTAPPGLPLEQVVQDLDDTIAGLRQGGAIPPSVSTELEGSAGKLADIRKALLGDGTLMGLMASSMFTSFVAVYLLMCILFQSWTKPLVIMFTVPLATFGGFLGLFLVHQWSLMDPYMPVQNLDVLTLLGFIILSGVVVNNAILIVAQADVLLKAGEMDLNTAIAKASQSRVRPIFMSLLTSVGGMLPLVLNPGSGSELYRGLGAVVVGGMLLSTFFTLILIPMLMCEVEIWRRRFSGGLKPAVISMVFLCCGCQVYEVSEKSFDEIAQPSDEAQAFDLALGKDDVHGDDHDRGVDSKAPSYSRSWWNQIDDEAYETLLKFAFEEELSLQMLEKKLERVLALSRQTQANWTPKVGGSVSIEREKIPAFQIPARNSFIAGLNMDVELDWLGRLKSQRRIAEARLNAVPWELEEHRLLIASTVLKHTLNHRSLLETEFLMKELRNNLSQQKGIAQVKVDQGLVTKSAFLELQVELERVEMNLASIRKDMDRERLMLEMWTGRRSGELKILLEKTLPPIKAFEIELGVPKDLLSRRPELQLAALHVVEKAQELSLSQKEMLPKLSLSGEVFFYGDSVDRWLTSDRAGFSFGPQLSWRLFEFGRIQQEKNAAAALYDEAVLAWRQAFRLAVKDVELSYELFQRDDQRWTSQQKIQKLREDKWIEDQTLLRFGRMAQAETLVSEQLLLQQKISSAEAFLQRQGSALKTQVSLGLPQHRLP